LEFPGFGSWVSITRAHYSRVVWMRSAFFVFRIAIAHLDAKVGRCYVRERLVWTLAVG
jgi:hypothetical protein